MGHSFCRANARCRNTHWTSFDCLSHTAGLGEFKLRDLNDEINKLIREKGHWEDRIKELGGPDYRVRTFTFCWTSTTDSTLRNKTFDIIAHEFVGLQKTGPKMLDHEGKEVPGNRGYKWVFFSVLPMLLLVVYETLFAVLKTKSHVSLWMVCSEQQCHLLVGILVPRKICQAFENSSRQQVRKTKNLEKWSFRHNELSPKNFILDETRNANEAQPASNFRKSCLCLFRSLCHWIATLLQLPPLPERLALSWWKILTRSTTGTEMKMTVSLFP